MKAVILAGGLGTRLSEETDRIPKPMVEIGGRPMLWHIMKLYGAASMSHFIVALGYKSDLVKDYFLRYRQFATDLTISLGSGVVTPHHPPHDDWEVELIDTGPDTNTGGRVKRLQHVLTEDTFCLTYGDGVCDVDLRAVVEFHRSHGRLATITAIRPPARFGGLVLDGDQVADFTEKPQIGEGWINGGFMVLDRAVLGRIEGDGASLEADVLEVLADEGQLMAYRHDGFWQSMDTLRDVRTLQALWDSGAPPWRTWE